MKVTFAIALGIVAAMPGLIGLAGSAAETVQKKSEAKPVGDAQEKAIKELQGDWRVLREETNGHRNVNIPSTAQIVVKGGEIEFSGPGDVCKLRLDSSKTPAQIDITFIRGPVKGKTVAGIYSLKEGRLTICLPHGPDSSAPRPKEFKSQPNDNLELVVLEHVGVVAPRKWLDKTEKHETTATYVGLSADGVRLQKTDGKIVTVPLDKLSDIDRQYVRVKHWLDAEESRAADAKTLPAKVEAEMKKAAESLAAGKTDEAINHYHKALYIKPDLAEAHIGLGQALAKRGQIDSAMQQFQQALAIKPDFAEAHNGMGLMLAGAAAGHPHDPFTRDRLTAEAIAHFRKAIELKPDFAEAKENLKKSQKAAQAGK